MHKAFLDYTRELAGDARRYERRDAEEFPARFSNQGDGPPGQRPAGADAEPSSSAMPGPRPNPASARAPARDGNFLALTYTMRRHQPRTTGCHLSRVDGLQARADGAVRGRCADAPRRHAYSNRRMRCGVSPSAAALTSRTPHRSARRVTASPRIAAHVDTLEWLGIERHVERHAVIARAAADAQADARELRLADIDTRRVARAVRRDAELGRVVDHGVFQARRRVRGRRANLGAGRAAGRSRAGRARDRSPVHRGRSAPRECRPAQQMLAARHSVRA